jgi:membrane associated rhomboid family serine protease
MEAEKRHFISSIYFPLLLVIILWVVKIYEWNFDLSFVQFGVLPRQIEGIKGIFLSPFIHGDFNHLISNTIPLFVLGMGLFYFYRKISYKVFLLIFVLTGMCLWLGGRPNYHIGASGVVYGLASFIFFSGLYRKNRALLAISLLTIFLYGSMFWGFFPVKSGVSWEGHLFGFITGIVMATYYKNEKVYADDDPFDDNSNISSTYDFDIFYEVEE